MEPAQHGVQDVMNISTEVHVFHRAILDLGGARLSLGGEETKDGHAFSSGGPSGQSRKRPYLYSVHPSGSDEFRHLNWSSPMFGLLKKSKPQQDVYFPFKTVFEKEQLIFDKKQFASNEFDFVQKKKKRQNRCDDEKWVHVFHRAILDLGRARLSLGGEETKDGHAFSSGGPSGQSRKRPYLYSVHPSDSDESRHLDWSSPWLALDRGYIKSHSASLDDPFNPSQFQKCRLPSRIISNTQLKFMFFTVPYLIWVEPDLAWVVKKPKTDMHSHPADHPDSLASVLIFTPCIHLVRMNLDILTGLLRFLWLALDRGYIKSHSASLDDLFNLSQFQKCSLPSRIISNNQLK
ncbi:hypothetical protein IGI04_036234 [Brassica rapa subsp. trilocularis]|uniref:Uncharacterized protein n=1 Tax=Brassica rapa subsp. trilocularis TaxID=1813537 RepID=A0ABQ7LGX1_BRACM|nr:hypothetical protein IGI04_036234 [Brassica rapa subsp. trilocularis]